LAYYTGPVFEAELTFKVEDEDGTVRPFGSVAGGGRYDDLVERFTGTKVPATGASIGVDRLLAALRASRRIGTDDRLGPIVVTVMDQARLPDYQRMVAELRGAGLAAELFLGSGGFRKQLKYADRRRAPIAVIAGGDELAAGNVSLKDLRLGAELAAEITDRDVWRKGRPAQVTVPCADLVAEVRAMLERS
jgi:histidyl-tRNA synthetase